MRKTLSITMKIAATIIAVAFILCAVFSISPVYDFAPAHPFSGLDIYNPYASLDTNITWAKANFHTHTRVKGPLNECKWWPQEVLADYRALGYDILTFSNHNEITTHPEGPELQVNVYEHGYGLFKYHKMVFGSSKVWHFDHLVPLLASQKQWQLDRLGRDSDFIQINHPFRTIGTSKHHMSLLEGYQIMELDSGKTTENEYWDWALSAGHYSFGLANDDCHDSKDPQKIALRANFLNTEGRSYEDIRAALMGGAYYSMRLPRGGDIPYIKNIGARGDTLFIELSRRADVVSLTGQDGLTLDSASDAERLEYVLPLDAPYARFTACFNDGAVIYSNPFARYDATKTPTPFTESEHSVNIWLTLLFNACLAAVTALLLFSLRSLWGSGRR